MESNAALSSGACSDLSVFPSPGSCLVIVGITVAAISRMFSVTLYYFYKLTDPWSALSVISSLVDGWIMTEEGRISMEKAASILVGE